MYIQNAKRWSRFSAAESLGGTVGLTLLALLTRLSLSPLIHPFAIFHFFILSCLATQFFFGYRYALTAVVTSVLLGEYFFVEPIGTFDELLIKDIIVSLNFIVVTGTAIVLMEILQRGAYARELLLKVNESRYLVSLQRENDRMYFAQKSSEAWVVLETLIREFDQVILLQHGPTVRLETLFYQIAGLSPSDVDPSQWMTYVHPDDRDKFIQNLQLGAKTEPPQRDFMLRLGNSSNDYSASVPVQVTRFVFKGTPLLLLTHRQTNSFHSICGKTSHTK